MIYLVLSILLSAYLGIVFTYFHKYKVDIFQAIVFNYGFCVITGSVVLGHFPINIDVLQQPFFKWAIAMGALFISVFNLIAMSSIKVGVTITQTANKLSLVIPVIFSYFLYQEEISFLKIVGILVAVIAVVLVSIKAKDDSVKKASLWEYSLPIILFSSSGIIDTLTKYVQTTFLSTEDRSNTYLICGFFMAFFFGFLILLYLLVSKKKVFQFKNVFAGMILGVPNYFSIYYFVKALQSNSLTSSATIPINNIGVLFVASMVGIFIFKEKLSKNNYVGLLLTLVAIVLIFLGDKM